MLLVLLNTSTQPPGLTASFIDFRLEMAAYIGYGTESTLWTADESAELTRGVQEAYRYIQRAALWSWKRQETTLTTVSGTASYTLPTNFGSIQGDITYASDAGFTHIRATSILDIRKRMQQSSASQQPWLYATRWAAQVSGFAQRQELVLYPPPNDAYVLTYEYAVHIGSLSETNPYPLGGQAISQLMIEGCKAIGEAKKYGARGDQWAQFEAALAQAIKEDAATLTERTVGIMGDPDGRYTDFSIRATSGSTYAGIG